MHIAFLTSEFPHEKVQHAAGIGTSIKNLVTALSHENIRVSVFVYGQNTDLILEENGIKIHIMSHKTYAFLGWYQHRKHIQNYVNQHIAADAIDLVEAADWTGITAFMKLDAPLVIRFHGSDAYFCHLEKRRQKIKNFLLEKWGIMTADAYIAPTNFAGKVTQYIFRIKNKTIKTIHYGLSLAQFHNPEPQQCTKGLILYMGTIIRKKGVLELPHILERVLNECPDAQLVIIGSDSYDLKTKSDSTWLLLQNALDGRLIARVKYLGKVPYQQVQEYIQKANVCIFPTFAETQGMVTIESMAMQKAVVNSNIGWAQELIDDGVNGYLVHPKAHDLYAQRIVTLLNDDVLCQKIGQAARQKVEEKFDIKKLVKANVDFYNELIKHKNT